MRSRAGLLSFQPGPSLHLHCPVEALGRAPSVCAASRLARSFLILQPGERCLLSFFSEEERQSRKLHWLGLKGAH